MNAFCVRMNKRITSGMYGWNMIMSNAEVRK